MSRLVEERMFCAKPPQKMAVFDQFCVEKKCWSRAIVSVSGYVENFPFVLKLNGKFNRFFGDD